MIRGGSGLKTAYGTFQLRCYPSRSEEPLVAWCSADSLLLDETHRQGLPGSDILVVNDAHGALCVALQPQALWTDSALSSLALRHNERVNKRAQTPLIWSTEIPTFIPKLVVLRIPKQLPYFEYQLAQLGRLLPQGTPVLAAGMDKHLSPRTAEILERHIGPTHRHRGQRKARLFTAVSDERLTQDRAQSWDKPETSAYHCDVLQAELHAFPNVFSREKLDIGTRFLLEQFHRIAPAESLIDLACGNGVVGLAAFRQGLASKVSFCDESAMAIRSARLNVSRIFPLEQDKFSFHHGDGLLEYNDTAAELILCNPPFHLQHTVDEFAGRHLLKQCSRHLQPQGRLYLVANKHLNYLPTLKRTFERVEKLVTNAKFNIFLAQKA
jgi:16S rRNA G1207 methylase RsmC